MFHSHRSNLSRNAQSRKSPWAQCTSLALAVALLASSMTPVHAQTALPSDAVLTSELTNGIYGTGDLMSAVGSVVQASSWLQASQAAALSSQPASGTVIACPAGGNANLSWTTSGKQTTLVVQFNQCALTSRNVVTGSFQQVATLATPIASCTTPKDKSTCSVTTQQDAIDTFNNVMVSMPYGAVTLHGTAETIDTTVTRSTSSTETLELKLAGANNLTWSTSYTFTDRSSSLVFSNADVTRITQTTSGTKTGNTLTGYTSITFTPANYVPVTVPVSFNGSVQFDSTGVVASGSASLTIPPNTVSLSVVPGTATICVDLGSDSMCDKTYIIDWSAWVNSTH